MPRTSKVEEAAAQMREFVENDNLVNELRMANEAKTRLLLINRILSILGWDDREHNPELVTSLGQFTDYRLSIDGVFQLIVEAKKIGRIKPIDSSVRKDEYDNIMLYRHCGDEMKELIDQCRAYCQQCCLPFAVATTGEMWIVMINFKQGFDWGKLRSVVFHSFDDILKRFAEFYGLLARESVAENSLNLKFETVVPKPSFAVRPRDVVGPSYDVGIIAHRQIIASYFEHFMGDITRKNHQDMIEMLAYCYVNDHEIDGYSRDLQQLLEYNVKLDEQEDLVISDADHETLEMEIELQLSSGNPRVILLVGNVGAGKSTFVHRFIAEHTDTELFNRKTGKQSICAVVGLLNRMSITVSPEHTREEHEHIADIVLDELSRRFGKKFDPFDLKVLRGCFALEVKRFREQNKVLREHDPIAYEIEEGKKLQELQKNKYKHLVAYIKYARKTYNTWIVFDNLDRGSSSYQRFVYLFAHQIADEAGCVTMITLREDTFLEAQAEGFFDVRSNDKIFRIKAPEFLKVVAKRRKYVDYLIEHNALPKGLKSEAEFVRLLNLHVRRLVTDANGLVRDVITQLSLSNVRAELDTLRDYYVSYHSTFGEFYNRHKERTTKQVAGEDVEEITLNYSHEYRRFIQSLMIGTAWAYKEGKIYNVFSVSPIETSSHFLKLRILAYFVYHLEHKYTTHRIALRYKSVSSDFLFLGFAPAHIDDALQSLLNAGLLVSPDLPLSPTGGSFTGNPRRLPSDLKIALSPRGRYYLKTLARHPYYLARVGDDMIWYDETSAKAYADCLEESIILQEDQADDAIQATDAQTIFTKYLEDRLLEERLVKDARFVATEWAKSIKHTLDHMILGGVAADDTIFAHVPQLQADRNDTPRVSRPASLDNHRNDASPKSVEDEPVAKQMNLFGRVVDDETGIKEAIGFVGTMPPNIKHGRSGTIVKVLWALEVAHVAGRGSQRAVDIAGIINRYGNGHVEPTNVARFMRQYKHTDYAQYWTEEEKTFFKITPEGRAFFQSIIAKTGGASSLSN